MGYLGKLTKTGALDTGNTVLSGGWTVKFDPADIGIKIPCEVYHIAVKGPSSSSFEVWLDTTFYDNAARGDKNSWDPNYPMHVTPGTTIFFYYDTTSTPAPKITLFFKEASPI